MHTEEDIVPPICARKIGQHGKWIIDNILCDILFDFLYYVLHSDH